MDTQESNRRDLAASEQRQIEVMRLYRAKTPIKAICEELGVARSTVFRDVARARAQWRAQVPQDYQALLDEKLAEIEDIRIEVMEAWRASMQPTVEERTAETKDGVFVTKTIRPPQPNAALMSRMLSSIELEAKLRGMLDRDPAETEEDAPQFIEVVVNSREELNELRTLTHQEFKEAAEAAEQPAASQSAEATEANDEE